MAIWTMDAGGFGSYTVVDRRTDNATKLVLSQLVRMQDEIIGQITAVVTTEGDLHVIASGIAERFPAIGLAAASRCVRKMQQLMDHPEVFERVRV